MEQSKEFRIAWNIILDWVKQDEFFVKPEHKTVGGMWTQDRWERDGIVVLLSEASLQIKAPAILDVEEGYTGVKFHKGGLSEMIRIVGEIAIEKERIANGETRPEIEKELLDMFAEE